MLDLLKIFLLRMMNYLKNEKRMATIRKLFITQIVANQKAPQTSSSGPPYREGVQKAKK